MTKELLIQRLVGAPALDFGLRYGRKDSNTLRAGGQSTPRPKKSSVPRSVATASWPVPLVLPGFLPHSYSSYSGAGYFQHALALDFWPRRIHKHNNASEPRSTHTCSVYPVVARANRFNSSKDMAGTMPHCWHCIVTQTQTPRPC